MDIVKFIVIAIATLLSLFLILPSLITILQNLLISLQGNISFGSLILIILVMSMVIFLTYCTISVLIAKGKKVKEGVDSMRSPSIVKIVTPIVTSTEQLVTKTYRGGRQVVSTIINKIKQGEHVDYYFKRSKKEKKLDKTYKDFTEKTHLDRMSFIAKHFNKK